MNTFQNNFEDHILQLATFAGKIALTSGAEIYRVEEVVNKIGAKFNLDISCFATLTCIIVSGKNSNGNVFSLVERISERSTNLDKICQVNQVIRNLDNYSFNELKEKLEEIDKSLSYPFRHRLLATALGGASFIVCFGGNANDFATAFVAGALISIFEYMVRNIKLNIFFTNLISSMICSFIACLFYKMEIITNPSISIISTLMLLVPGVSFINSIRDIIAGDLVSGISRAGEVATIGSAIAVGVGLILKLFLVSEGV